MRDATWRSSNHAIQTGVQPVIRRHSRLLVIAGTLQIFYALSAPGQQVRKMTIDWMFGDSASWVSTPPSSQWLSDGTLLLLVSRNPADPPAFELLDPRSGKRKQAFELKSALASLKALIPDDTSSSLPWPASVDAAGKRAVYLLSGDVMLLNMPEAECARVTQTAAEERAASVSPDGKHIAFVRNNDLYLYDPTLKREQRITHDGNDSLLNGLFSWVYWEEVFGHQEAAVWWSPDSRSIAFLRTDESSVGTMCFPDFQPYQPAIHKQRYPQAGQHNPAATLGIADVTTGETTWMRLPSGSYEYIVQVNWLPGSDRVAVQTMNRAQTEVTLYFVDRSTGNAATVLTESDEAWMHHYAPLFAKNGKYFIWISERTGYTHAYRYSMAGKLLNQITTGNWSLAPFGEFYANKESPLRALDERTETLFFTAKEKSSLETHVYRIRLDGTGLKRLSQEDGDHLPCFSPDTQFYLDTYSSASSPPSLTLRRSDGTELQTVSVSRSDLIAPYAMQFPSFFSIPAADGFLLPAQISKPRDFDPTKKYPVIVYVYGGPGSASVRNKWNANDWSETVFFDQVLLSQGCLVLSVDNRSSASIGMKYEKSIKGQMYGDVELHDLESAIKWLKAQSFVDPDRVGIWGWSGGGMYTLLALTHTKEFKAGIAIAPVTDWHYYDSKWTELWMKRPEDNPEGYQKTSLVQAATDLHGRLFLAHGTYDDNVHPQNSQAFMNQLIKAGITFDFMVYPMRHHTIDDAPAKIHLYKTMLEFWKKNL
jgi:dipeptidyl-peptidase 4